MRQIHGAGVVGFAHDGTVDIHGCQALHILQGGNTAGGDDLKIKNYIIDQLKEKPLAEDLAIPSVMLRSEGDLFLDGVSVEDVERELGVTLKVDDCTGGSLFGSFMGQ